MMMRLMRISVGLAVAAAGPAVAEAADAAASPATTQPAGQAVEAELRHLQDAYGQLLSQHPDDADLKAFDERLRQVEQFAASIRQRIGQIRREALSSLLDVSGPAPAARGSNKARRTPVSVSQDASELLLEAAETLAGGLAKPQLDEQALGLLRDYYNARLAAASRDLWQAAWSARVTDPERMAEICRLAMVLPLLATPDENWTLEHIRQLPEWLRAEKNLPILRRFALVHKRLQTAYQFHLIIGPGKGPATRPASFGEFLAAAAKELATQRDYRAAMACYRQAIALAESEKDTARVCEQRIALSELLEQVGHPALAADEMRQLAAVQDDSPQLGRIAMLRLKYLYAAGQYPTILQESPQYEANALCRSYWPQLLYLRWVTHRRLDQAQQGQEAQEAFLADYPDHPLGADMYFSSAMSALAASDYAEALRLLEVVEYRYPKYKGMAKVKEVRTRLQARTQGANP